MVAVASEQHFQRAITLTAVVTSLLAWRCGLRKETRHAAYPARNSIVLLGHFEQMPESPAPVYRIYKAKGDMQFKSLAEELPRMR